jgi:hypothetical protein
VVSLSPQEPSFLAGVFRPPLFVGAESMTH